MCLLVLEIALSIVCDPRPLDLDHEIDSTAVYLFEENDVKNTVLLRIVSLV